MNNYSLKQFIGLVVVGLFLLFSAVVSLIMIRDSEGVLKTLLRRQERVKIELLSRGVSRALEQKDDELVARMISVVKEDPDIYAVEVLDADGRLVSFYPSERRALKGGADKIETRRQLMSARGRDLGRLRVVSSEGALKGAMRHEIYLGLGVLLVMGTIFIGLLFFLLNRFITVPLARLGRAVAGQSKGPGARRPMPFLERGDEIGRLAKAFSLVFAELSFTTSEYRRSEERLQAILDNSPAIITLQDRQGRYILMNRRGREVFSREGSMSGKTDLDIFPSERAEERQKMLKKIIATSKALKVEENLVVNGETHTFLAIKFPLLNADNEATAVCCIATDITSRKQAEADASRLALAVSQVSEMIIISDAQGLIKYVNPAYEKISGHTSSEVIGLHIDEVNDDDCKGGPRQEDWNGLRDGTPWRGRVVHKRADGSFYECETVISPVRDSRGDIRNFVAVARDVSREVRLEAQIQHGRKLKAIGELAAGIAHEINTPMQYIGDNLRFAREAFGSFAEIMTVNRALAQTSLADDEILRHAEEIAKLYDDLDVEYLLKEAPLALEQSLSGAKRVVDIIAAMKNFAHPGSVKMTFVNLNAAIISTIAVARNEWKNVACVETNLDQSLPSIPCLPGEFNQVVLNFLINAVHAIKERLKKEGEEGKKGKIVISTILNKEWVDIVISDTGIGIADEHKSRIFDPFFTTKGVGEGTGQGLAIANNVIVNKHHGVIHFDSEYGSGTTFVIKLPLEQDMS